VADDEEEKARAAEWAAAPKTEVVDPITPSQGIPTELAPVEHTGRVRLTPEQFASGLDGAERDGFQRGVEYGKRLGRAEAEADNVMELRRVREECVEAFRSFYVIWAGTWPETWEEAQAWFRKRLPPL
jgi:hypothetical protein